MARLPAVVVSHPPDWAACRRRPLLESGEERLARRVLGDVEITEAAGERGDTRPYSSR